MSEPRLIREPISRAWRRFLTLAEAREPHWRSPRGSGVRDRARRRMDIARGGGEPARRPWGSWRSSTPSRRTARQPRPREFGEFSPVALCRRGDPDGCLYCPGRAPVGVGGTRRRRRARPSCPANGGDASPRSPCTAMAPISGPIWPPARSSRASSFRGSAPASTWLPCCSAARWAMAQCLGLSRRAAPFHRRVDGVLRRARDFGGRGSSPAGGSGRAAVGS